MPRRLGPGLLLAAALGGGAFAQAASAQVPVPVRRRIRRKIDADGTDPGQLHRAALGGALPVERLRRTGPLRLCAAFRDDPDRPRSRKRQLQGLRPDEAGACRDDRTNSREHGQRADCIAELPVHVPDRVLDGGSQLGNRTAASRLGRCIMASVPRRGAPMAEAVCRTTYWRVARRALRSAYSRLVRDTDRGRPPGRSFAIILEKGVETWRKQHRRQGTRPDR